MGIRWQVVLVIVGLHVCGQVFAACQFPDAVEVSIRGLQRGADWQGVCVYRGTTWEPGGGDVAEWMATIGSYEGYCRVYYYCDRGYWWVAFRRDTDSHQYSHIVTAGGYSVACSAYVGGLTVDCKYIMDSWWGPQHFGCPLVQIVSWPGVNTITTCGEVCCLEECCGVAGVTVAADGSIEVQTYINAEGIETTGSATCDDILAKLEEIRVNTQNAAVMASEILGELESPTSVLNSGVGGVKASVDSVKSAVDTSNTRLGLINAALGAQGQSINQMRDTLGELNEKTPTPEERELEARTLLGLGSGENLGDLLERELKEMAGATDREAVNAPDPESYGASGAMGLPSVSVEGMPRNLLPSQVSSEGVQPWNLTIPIPGGNDWSAFLSPELGALAAVASPLSSRSISIGEGLWLIQTTIYYFVGFCMSWVFIKQVAGLLTSW